MGFCGVRFFVTGSIRYTFVGVCGVSYLLQGVFDRRVCGVSYYVTGSS